MRASGAVAGTDNKNKNVTVEQKEGLEVPPPSKIPAVILQQSQTKTVGEARARAARRAVPETHCIQALRREEHQDEKTDKYQGTRRRRYNLLTGCTSLHPERRGAPSEAWKGT